MLGPHIRSRMFELEEVRTWERNPSTMPISSRPVWPARRCLRTRRRRAGAACALEAAADAPTDSGSPRQHQGSARHLRQGWHRGDAGVLTFIEHDLPRAFSNVDDLHLLGDLADAQTEALQSIGAYVESLEKEIAPRARASFRLGREKFEQKVKLDEGLHVPVDRLLAIATRELKATQEAFKRVAGRMNGGDPLETWARTKAGHPAPGELVAIGRDQLDELKTYLERQALITLPPGEPITVAPTPEFYRWSFASMWTPGPFESKPSRAYYYLTDVDRSWPEDRQEEHLRDYNYPTLWSISIHEVYPGHFLHYQHLRRVESKARKSILFAPASFVEGWAHYCEQMMIEAGFGARITAWSSDSSPKPSSGSCDSSSASDCTPKICRLSKACVSSGKKPTWRKRALAERPSAAPSIRPIWCTRLESSCSSS